MLAPRRVVPTTPYFLMREPSKIRSMRSFLRIVAGVGLVAAVAFTPPGSVRSGRGPHALLAAGPAQAGQQDPGAGGQTQPRQGQQQGSQPKNDQQAPGDQPQTPVFRSGINFVRVDVIVSDKNGGPVADLKQTDFEVLEDGKPQSIETFKMIKLDGGTTPTPDGQPPRQIRTDLDEETEAARDDVRLFALFLDDYHVRLGASQVVREPLTRFIERQLGPSDM